MANLWQTKGPGREQVLGMAGWLVSSNKSSPDRRAGDVTSHTSLRSWQTTYSSRPGYFPCPPPHLEDLREEQQAGVLAGSRRAQHLCAHGAAGRVERDHLRDDGLAHQEGGGREREAGAGRGCACGERRGEDERGRMRCHFYLQGGQGGGRTGECLMTPPNPVPRPPLPAPLPNPQLCPHPGVPLPSRTG